MYMSLLFNSVILMLVNFGIACYFGRKVSFELCLITNGIYLFIFFYFYFQFFRVMKNHYQLVSEIADFNSVVSFI